MTARTAPPNTPPNDSQLFDRLHEWFGIGTYVEEVPWWKFRQVEVSKIKRSRKSRDASIVELYVAACYCRAHRLPVGGITWLYRHIPAAWRWLEAQQHAIAQTPDERYAAAIRDEINNPDPLWLNRLMRATPAAREEVLAEWLRR